MVDTLSRMFESPTSDSAKQVEIYLVLTEFSLAFHKLAQLQWVEPTFVDIVAQLEKGDMVDSYTLSKGILYCRRRKTGDLKFVVPSAVIPVFSPTFMSRS